MENSVHANKKLIEIYCVKEQKKLYEEILKEYKVRYIYSESKVEGNITPEEQLGISTVYDYIRDFNFEKDYFNIFTTSLLIHQKLYSHCPYKSFGGSLRESEVFLKDSSIEVISAEEAKKFFNSFIATSDQIFKPLEECDILTYIEKCIEVTTELIKAQPFGDGNKRTFRSLLNLLLKKISLPPVYIPLDLRKEYKDSLLKAMEFGNYRDLYELYYLLIEKSIRELALENKEYETTKKIVKRLVNDMHNIQ